MQGPVRPSALSVLAVSLLVCQGARGDEHALVLELGSLAEWDLNPSERHLGPSLSLEMTPIEHWLELEAGISALRVQGVTEWETELLFKKPFELTDSAELMVGAGPTWTHGADGVPQANVAGVELAVDLMLWRGRRWGWFLEPNYGVEFARGHARSVGLSGGLLLSPP
jgi:hypothetical protein